MAYSRHHPPYFPTQVEDVQPLVHPPRFPWEPIQNGNCGPPIEIDKDNPAKVLGRASQPVLSAAIVFVAIADLPSAM